MYLELVSKYKSQYKFRLFSYCLLPDRLEMLIETGQDASISEVMHDINSLYTKYYNGRYQKRGHLFEARFRSVLVEKAHYLVDLTRHVHSATWRHEKTYSQSLAEYPYSSFQFYVHHEASRQTTPDMREEVQEVLRFLREKDQSASYEKYVLEGDRKEIEFMEKTLRRGQVLGSDTFQRRVKERVREHAEELEATDVKLQPSRTLVYLIGGLVLVATLTTLTLYVRNQDLQEEYASLLTTKEAEFASKARFENASPLTLADLDGTRWAVDVVPAPRGGVLQKERMVFKGGRFTSDLLAAKGFRPAAYFLQPQGGRVVQWQAAQSNSAGEQALWRGTWHGDVMKGTLEIKDVAKTSKYLFFSTSWKYEESR